MSLMSASLTLFSYNTEHYWSVVYLYIDEVHLGTDSKWRSKNTQKFHLIPAYIKKIILQWEK